MNLEAVCQHSLALAAPDDLVSALFQLADLKMTNGAWS